VHEGLLPYVLAKFFDQVKGDSAKDTANSFPFLSMTNIAGYEDSIPPASATMSLR
jgi:hypothetical protein